MKKDVKKNRIKKYFIDAAKEILINEGVTNISVRKVGEATGYSYATIYNYFESLDHLLWYAGVDFIQDIIKIYESDFIKEKYTPEDIKQLLRKYIAYYFQNPNVFKFFFFYQTEEPPEVVKQEFVRPSLERIQIGILKNLAQQGIIEHEKVHIISSLIMNSVHGMLLMYFSGKRKITEQEIYSNAEEVVRFLLRQ
ncbi:MAG: TetR/AcrR family transcriptional regulator [Clostridia bacterium]|nr:TetR/AcrR family transcriptional regulator [Clostridia bacterium]